MSKSSTPATIRTKGCRATTLLAIAAALGAPVVGAPRVDAQQVLEIDTAAGRVIIDDEWRAVHTLQAMTLDRDRAIIYVNDAEEPEGVMAFSLDTGEWLQTIRTPTGDGPFELSRGKTGMALGGDGSLYVSGYVRVLEFDPLGVPVSSWRPRAAVPTGVCAFDGQPAIPAGRGVIRRGPNGEDEVIGPGDGERAAAAAGESRYRPEIACGEDAAYVLSSNEESPDSVIGYRRGGETVRFAVPAEVAEGWEGCTVPVTVLPGVPTVDLPCSNITRRLNPSLDGHGDVVLLGHNAVVSGAIIDPETGCYAVMRKPAPSFAYDALGVYRDSALVFRYDTGRTVQGNRITISTYSEANRVSLHPLRRVDGEPCPGMLPSVGEDGDASAPGRTPLSAPPSSRTRSLRPAAPPRPPRPA